jgi:hypothetical protein
MMQKRSGATAVRGDRTPHGAVRRVWLAIALALAGASLTASAQGSTAELLEARVRLARAFEPLVEAARSLDARAFDVDALALDLAFEEADDVVAEVHRRVRYQPYRGVLRGALGTLAGGAGNALDQALLTATLLRTIGYEVEIRGATLDDARVATLLAQLRSHDPSLAREAGGVAEIPALTAATAALEAEADERVAGFLADVERAGGLLEAVLVEAVASGVPERVARDYHWLAYRLHAGEAWTDAHPVFGTTPAGWDGLVAEVAFADEVPAELQHRFRFQALLERRVGDELEVVPLMEAWERPVANLVGVPLGYANVPDGLGTIAPGADLDALRAATSFFFPMWNGDVPPGASAFDLLGNVVPPDAASSPFAGLFQTVGRNVGSALGALGGLGASDAAAVEPFALTAQWLEYTLIEPGGAETTHRRMVVDRIDGDARAAGATSAPLAVDEREAFASLQSSHTLLLDVGAYGAGYRAARGIEAVLAVRGLADAALVAAAEGRAPPALDPAAGRLEELLAGLTLFGAFDDAPTPGALASYRPAPALVVLSQRLDGREAAVDVVANPRWTLRAGPAGPELDPTANLRAGAWETRTEGLVLTRPGAVASPAFEALEVIAAGERRDLLPGDVAAADALALPAAARAAIREDLARGYAVVAPGSWDGRRESVGWWRIDPTTGEALGRGADGRGNAFAEYLTSFEVSITITGGFAVYGAHQCSQIADARTAGCCLVQNVALAAVGTAVGVGLGIAYTTTKAAMIIFGAMDVGFNVVGVFLPTFCPGG